MRASSFLLFTSIVAVGCGGSKPPPSTADTSATASAAPSAAASTAPSASATAATASTDEDDVDPAAKTAIAAAGGSPGATATGASLTLDLLVHPPARAADFPKASATDAECNKGMTFTGGSVVDYDRLVGKCGTPTGLKEYVKKVTGKLDATHMHDKYAFHMAGGFCYRFFAVADKTVTNVTIRIQRKSGDLVSIASSRNFISIMDPDTTWCKTHDRDFDIIVETSAGQGNYAFGIWARPKP
ncbi:hypothetical protein BH09MYX1_BH09MYX1_33580 [soil metagenome]